MVLTLFLQAAAGSYIPVWLGAVGALITIAAGLGAATAVYRTSLQSTSLREAERTMERLRGEIADYQRRESELAADVRVLSEKNDGKESRIRVLEDLINKRQDDHEIRAEIAAVRKVVDENVMAQLTTLQETMSTLLLAVNGVEPS
jgi:chromosome segregation ATPase